MNGPFSGLRTARGLHLGAIGTILAIGLLAVIRGPPSGPLSLPPLTWNYVPTEVGGGFTDGTQLLRFPGVPNGAMVLITGIEAEFDEPARIPFAGAFLAGERQSPPGGVASCHSSTSFSFWPPVPEASDGSDYAAATLPGLGPLIPAIGTLIPAEAPGGCGWQLLLGYDDLAPGRNRRPTITIHYQVDGRRYVAVLTAGWVLCPGDHEGCEGAAGEEFHDSLDG